MVIVVQADGAYAANGVITARGAASFASYGSESTTSLSVSVPAGTQPGDLLIASLGFGKSGASSSPVLTPPANWALIMRTNQGNDAALAVFRHTYASGESQYSWTTNMTVGGTVFVTAFDGVDTTNPVDVFAGNAALRPGANVSTPSVTTTTPGEMLVANYFAYNGGAKGGSWTPPAGMSEVGDTSNGSSRSGCVDTAVQASAGSSGVKTARASATSLDYAIAVLIALRPASGATDTTPPAISAVKTGSIGSTSATVSWTTDEPADSQVEYGPTTAYGTSTTLNGALVTTHGQTLTALSPNTLYHYRVKSNDAAGNHADSADNTFTTTNNAPPGPVPVIVDTDIYSDADDVGALAIAFALQQKGEANIIAIGINTRTSRPAVATNSWRCAAAIAQFYGAGSVPIGSDMPDNGTSTNSPDFVGPCATRASPSTPSPGRAVDVYRQALAAQPDGSVVMIGTGYEENLAALLASGPDTSSALNGQDLVARKVKTLVLMAGGYPSRNGETNLVGNPAAAQAVTGSWPTKIVWAGYEVGDAIHTGNTISQIHPSNSPVRIAYEAFVGPNNWIYSYDLVAVYHAIRPGDAVLSEVGPGRNTVFADGSNSFSLGSGNQFYLTLASATSLDASIEALLDVLPTTTPDTTPPAISAVAAGSISSTSATVTWTTDEPADTQVEYGPTTAYGTSTTLNGALVTTHSQTLTALNPNTLYHYRVKSNDAAGNHADSADNTFTTTNTASPGPSDTFDSNVLDGSRWVVTASGSSAAAANQELEITHPSGGWTKATVSSATAHNQTGKSLQVQVKRAANNGLGGSTYGETSVFLWLDASHYVYFFIAGGAMTAWVNSGAGETNLTPSWPKYDSTSKQWVRFRESGGTLFLEYAAGATAPGTWTTLASLADPFAMTSVTFRMAAGSNVSTSDVAKFDNVSTY